MIIESCDSYIILELNSSSFNLIREEAGNLTAIQISDYSHKFIITKNGLKLPVVEMTLDIPPGAKLKLKMLDYEGEVFSLNLPDPVSVIEDIGENNRFKRKLIAKFKHRFLPFSLVEIEVVDESKAKIKFYPLLFDSENEIFEFYKYIKVKILFKSLKRQKLSIKSLTSESDFYKISLNEDGIYKVTKDDLLAAGLDPGKLELAGVALYNKGKKIAININKDQDSNFEFLEFFAESNDSRYSLDNIYWLKIKFRFPLTMRKRNVSANGGINLSYYLERAHFQENLLYQRSILEGDEIEHWFWKKLIAPNAIEIDFQLQNIAQDEALAKIDLGLQGYSHTSQEPDHHVIIYLNDNFLADVFWDGARQYVFSADIPLTYLLDGQNILRIEAPGDTGAAIDTIYLDYFEITYPRYFLAKDDILRFQLKGFGRRLIEVSGFSNREIQLFDITRPRRPKRLLNAEISSDEDGNFKIKFGDWIRGEKRYLILTSDKKITPASIIEDTPSNLKTWRNQADYIIITHSDFKDAILPLVEFRQNKGLIVKVVDVQDIYDEFNFGIFSPVAIKEFLKFAYNHWQIPPQYVLLVGDASYDYKDYLGLGSINFVPTIDVQTKRMLAPSDNWFVCIEGEDNLPEIAIGRLPVATKDELEFIINKIIDYESDLGPVGWNQNIMLVADNDEIIFETIQDELVENYIWPSFNVKKIYLSNYQDASSCHQDIIDGINSGALLLNYVGHGAEPLWANELIFSSTDIDLVNNYQMYPVIPAMTCLNTYFHYPYSWFNGISETFLKAQGKGIIAFWSPSGLTSPREHRTLENGFYSAIFQQDIGILGNATKEAEIYLYENCSSAQDLLKTIILLGDPALELDLP